MDGGIDRGMGERGSTRRREMLAGWLVGWLGTGWVVVHVLELSGAGMAGKAVGHLRGGMPRPDGHWYQWPSSRGAPVVDEPTTSQLTSKRNETSQKGRRMCWKWKWKMEVENGSCNINQPAPTSRSVSKHFPRGPWPGPGTAPAGVLWSGDFGPYRLTGWRRRSTYAQM